ncbi:MAG: hypothetical protein DCC46_11395 [Armatimonadetes bacterium]|nr:MAG: hypothetical protein DCC46_11395 [Armatimonadota bacterium]
MVHRWRSSVPVASDLPVFLRGYPDSRCIVGIRNLLAHGYAQVDDARAWDIVENDLPKTLGEIERLLEGK